MNRFRASPKAQGFRRATRRVAHMAPQPLRGAAAVLRRARELQIQTSHRQPGGLVATVDEAHLLNAVFGVREQGLAFLHRV